MTRLDSEKQATGVPPQSEFVSLPWSSPRFQSLLLHTIDAMIVARVDLSILYASPGLERRFGLSVADPGGGNLADLVHPEDFARVRSALDVKRAAEEAGAPVQARLQPADGAWAWFDMSCAALGDDPAENAVIVVSRNSSSQVQVEEALRLSEARFRSAFNAAVDVVSIIDADGIVQYQTPSIENVLGYGARQFYGRYLGDIVSPPLRTAWQSRLERVASDVGTSHTGEWQLAHCDGGWRTCEVTWNNLLGDPAVRGIIVIARDVTELRRTEQRLRAQARLLDLAHDAIVVIHPETGRITFWNLGAQEMYGYSPEEAVGSVAHELLRTEYPELDRASIDARMLVDERWEGELIQYTGERARLVVASRWALFRTDEGHPLGILVINHDITRRKHAEDNLKLNEALLAESQRLAHVGSWEWNLLDSTIRWSDELYRIMGHRPGSITPTYDGFLEIVREDLRERVRETLELAVASGTSFKMDYAVIMPDGSEKAVSAIGDALSDGNGALIAFRGAVQDVTERTSAEERMRAQAGLLDLAHDAIRVIGWNDDRITYWNNGATELYGFSREEAIGSRSQVLLRTEFPEPGLNVLKERLLVEHQWEGEIVHYRRDGQRIVVASRWALQCDEHGLPSGILQINRDITQRKAAEEDMRRNAVIMAAQVRDAQRARGESRAVLDAASEAMILLSPEFGHVLTVNLRFTEFFGHASSDIIGSTGVDLAAWIRECFENAGDVTRLICDTWSDSERQIVEIVAQRSPERRELQLFSNPVLGHDGAFFGRLYAFRDITLEREIDRMKSEFISLVSHELRTPLTSIKGYVDVLLDGDLGPIPADQERFLRIASQNTDRLVVLINELLDISRIESGHVDVERVPLDLTEVVESVVASMQPQLAGSGHQLRIDMTTTEPSVLGDRQRVTQILTNLLSNAIKYTPQGGSIGIRAEPDGPSVRVQVSDSGIGLSPDEQLQLFSKFYRAKNSVTQRVGGTGLGLVITRALVEMQGGSISVRSASGEGSTFSFTLPATAKEWPIASPAPKDGSKRILVVEDDPEIADLIRYYLEQAGFQVAVAETGAASLALAQSEDFDLITLDILLPDRDGYGVLEELKRDPTLSSTPVLLISILPNDGRGAVSGAAGVITKPLDKQALLDQVQVILASHGT